jgi:hypothetical protein
MVKKIAANKVCTGRWGFCRIFKHFSGFEFSLLPNRVHARPSASNANRYVALESVAWFVEEI